MKKTLAILLIAALALAGAGTLNIRLLHLRGELHLTQAPPTQNMPPLVAFTTVALGGFRGILADVLWMRAGTLQDEGRYFELVQLSDWIVKLQPRSPAIWAYHAWNMAYNISALMSAPAERWRWVRNGLVLLRDEGMVYNPGSARLHQELAWMFLHKLGSRRRLRRRLSTARNGPPKSIPARSISIPPSCGKSKPRSPPSTGARRKPRPSIGPWPDFPSPAPISTTSPSAAWSIRPCSSASPKATAPSSPPPSSFSKTPSGAIPDIGALQDVLRQLHEAQAAHYALISSVAIHRIRGF